MVRVSERVSESDEFTGCFWMKDLPAAAVTGAQSTEDKISSERRQERNFRNPQSFWTGRDT